MGNALRTTPKVPPLVVWDSVSQVFPAPVCSVHLFVFWLRGERRLPTKTPQGPPGGGYPPPPQGVRRELPLEGHSDSTTAPPPPERPGRRVWLARPSAAASRGTRAPAPPLPPAPVFFLVFFAPQFLLLLAAGRGAPARPMPCGPVCRLPLLHSRHRRCPPAAVR